MFTHLPSIHLQEIHNPMILQICMYYPACLWCCGQVWNYAGHLPSIATGNLRSKQKTKKKSVAYRCQGFHCEVSAAPSLINKVCRKRSLQRLLCLLQGITGCCESAKWNRLSHKHLQRSGGKKLSCKAGQIRDATQPTIRWVDFRVDLQYWHRYSNNSSNYWYYLSLQPPPGCTSESEMEHSV